MIDLLPNKYTFIKQCSRKHEAHYNISSYICEFWNTISNLVFIIIGIIRLQDEDLQLYYPELVILYSLFTMAGFCSGLHHMLNFKYTIFIDWLPIASSIVYLIYHSYLLEYFTLVSWLKIIFAFVVLVSDHAYTIINVPWGHVFWHILIGFAIDGAYQDVFLYY
jgi:hypothetical protein